MSNSSASPLTDEECAFIDALAARLRHMTFYELLGVTREADRKTIRDAYFALSQRWHPDVFYKRGVGDRGTLIEEIFKALTAAYDTLSNAQRRAAYDRSVPITVPLPPVALPTASASAGGSIPPPSAATPTQPASIPPPRVPTGVDAAPTSSVATRSPMSAPLPAAPPPNPRPPSPLPPSPASSSRMPPPAPPAGAANVVPSSLPPPRAVVARPVAQGPVSPADAALRAKAKEVMAMKLGAQVGLRSRPTLPPPRLANTPSAEEARGQRVQALCEQADALRTQGDFEGALERLRAAEAIDRNDPGLRTRLDAVLSVINARKADDLIVKADLAKKEGRVIVAVELYERAVEARLDAEVALRGAELCLRKKELHRRGVDLAQKALQAKPDHIKALVVLAQIFVATELKASARGAVDRAAKLDPDNPEVKALRATLGPVSLAEQLGLRNR